MQKNYKKIRPDIIHGHFITDFGLPTIFFGNYPKVVSAMGSDISSDVEKSKISMLNCKLILKKADIVLAHDEPAKRRLMELGCDEKKIFVQQKGVHVSKFSPNAKSQALKEKLGIVDKYSVINARALINDKYHVDVFINAIVTIQPSKKLRVNFLIFLYFLKFL